MVRNKIDLDAVGPGRVPAAGRSGSDRTVFEISASRGDGLGELMAALIRFSRDYFGSDNSGLIGRARQRQLLQETAASLQRSMEVLGEGEELAAEHLRVAAHSLGRLLGRVDVEDILDVIFREFCIGK
jgi:tRNA modification GTPase